MTTLQVTFVSESADYSSSFGWYNTRTGEAGILFFDTNDLSGGTSATLDVLQSDIDAGNIGFFLIPDGADRYSTLPLEGPLSFDTLGNGTGVILDASGNRLVGAQGEVIFTDDSLNKKGVDYTLGDDDGNIEGTIAFEDLVKRSDGDFNDLVVNVQIVDDNQVPVVEDQSFTVTENAAAGAAVGTVAASDPDAGQGLTYRIIGGNDDDLFTIDAATGEIRVAGALDFEAVPAHTLTVEVSDGTLTDTALVSIGVSDVPEDFAGNVIDGYIAGATVFADADFDGELDAGEASSTTDTNGNFSLTGATGPLVMFGGTDISTGLAFTGVLRAPAGSTVVTPLTTLVAALVDQGQSVADATDNVKNALGIDASIDLLDFDPVPAAVDGDTSAAQVLAAGIQVQNAITQISALLGGAGAADASDAVIAEIAELVASGATVDLASAATTAVLISGAADAVSVNVDAVIADAAAVLADANALAEDAAAAADVTALAQVAAVAQGSDLTGDLADAGAANDPGTLGTDYTGANLETQVADTEVGDVDGATLGTPDNDLLVGGAANDIIEAFGGNDVLEGHGGNDLLLAGLGNDTLRGGAGNDLLDGGFVNDLQSVLGFSDSDRADYSAAAGPVEVDLSTGSALDGEGGTDTIVNVENVTGSAFADSLSGSNAFFETFTGGAGDDFIDGRGGQDRADYANATGAIVVQLGAGTVAGDASVGTDQLVNVEQIFGTSFDDTYDANGFFSNSAPGGLFSTSNSFDGLGGNDQIIGNGNTRVSYVGATSAVTVNLALGFANGDPSVGTDTFTGVNAVRGSNFDDTLTGGNPFADGFESFEGRAGNDQISGGSGFDLAVYGFDGLVSTGIFVDLAAGIVTGDPLLTGTDTLSGVEAVRGSFRDDTFNAGGFSGLSANAGSLGTLNEFEGLAGNDLILGNGNTRITYGGARESVAVDFATSTVTGGASVGTDSFSGVNAVRGSNFADTIDASAAFAPLTLEGLAGNDHIRGGSAADTLIGGPGDDTLLGGLGNDRFIGGAGNDYMDGGFNFDLQTFEGFLDLDRVDYGGAFGPVTVNLGTGVAFDGEGGTDTLVNIESVTGSRFDDQITGSATFFEIFVGGPGNDLIDGGAGAERVDYSGSFDGVGIDVNLAAGTVTGGFSVGTDILHNVEQVFGTHFNDTYVATAFVGEAANGAPSPFNSFDPMGGNDTIIGNGYTRLSYQNAGEAVTIDLNLNFVSGGPTVGFDTFSGVNYARGSGGFADTLIGSGADELFDGRGGNDLINGGGGIDTAVYTADGPMAAGLTISLAAGTVVGDPVRTGTDTLLSVEAVRGSYLDDLFDATGFSSSSLNAGSNGTLNEFEGIAGNDTIIGNGNTRLSYSTAREAVTVNLALGTATGGASVGTDTFTGVNAVRGSNFNDTLLGINHGIASQHTFEGRGGNDFINGAGGFDQAAYNNDFTSTGISVQMASIDASTGRVMGDAAIGMDTITGIASVRGTNFDDTYNAFGFNSTLTGIGTFNEFEGGGGNDQVFGNGNTRITFINAGSSVTVDMAGGTASGLTTGEDIFSGVSQVRGSNFGDTLLGSFFNDTFEGRGGDDFIDGRFGFDTARYDFATGPGSFIWDPFGVVTASAGGQGVDTLISIEAVRGTNFDDLFDASAAFFSVQLEGMAGNDLLTGGASGDTLLGGAGNDALQGNLGNDRLVGGAGDDVLDGGFEFDLQSAIGFSDNDRADYSAAPGAVTVNLATGIASDGEGGADTLLHIESVTGSAFNDQLTGSGRFFESYVGGAGDDTIDGGLGQDRAEYGSSFSGITVQMATGTVTGDASVGQDHLIEVEQIVGTGSDDLYDATGFMSHSAEGGLLNPFNSFDGLGGNDHIVGNGNTRVSYQNAGEAVTVDLANGTATGGPSSGSDTFSGVNSVRGSNFGDILLGSERNDLFEGRNGNDSISGGGGIDQAIYAFDGAVATGISVDLAAGTVTGDALLSGTDTLSSVEAVRGSFRSDVFNAIGFSSFSLNAGSNGTFNEFEGMAGDDQVFGNGNTRVSYLNAREAVTVNLALGTASGGDSVGNDTFSGVNAVRGSNFGDTLIGFNHGINASHVFEGRGGDDTIDGAGGFDQAAYHNDFTSTGITVDMAALGASTGQVFGDAQIGTDTITGIASVRGTAFADTYDAVGFNSAVTGIGTFNEFDGGAGDDLISGNGNTRLTYVNASDGVTVDLEDETATGDASVGTDHFTGVTQVRGSNFADTLLGSELNNTLEGRGGDDTIDGRGGFDTARYDAASNGGSFTWSGTGTLTASAGGQGFDTLTGIEAIRGTNFDDFYNASADAGGVRIEGNAGNDRFIGGAGNDFFHGGFVNDLQSVAGFTDSDRVDYSAATGAVTVNLALGAATGGGGNDALFFIENVTGSAFDDLIIGSGQFFETFAGGAGNDTIDGGAGGDRADYSGATEGINAHMASGTVMGGGSVGNDQLFGVEQLLGTSFNDVYDATGALFGNSFDPLGGDDSIVGNGNTRISYSTLGEGVTVDLALGVVDGVLAGHDTFSGVNSVRGSNFADQLLGTDASEFFEGRSGNDMISGGGGFDTAIFSFDGPVNVGITVGLGAGTVFGDFRNGFDSLSSIEAVRGSFQSDFFDATGFSELSANAGSFGSFNEFEGMAGNDTIIGNGNTRVSYSQAREAVSVDLGAGTASGGVSVGFDTFTGVNAVNGSNFDDVLRGSAGDDQLFGGNGNDLLSGGLGADFINLFGAGRDRVDFDHTDEAVDVVFNFDGLPGGDVLDIADLLDSSTSYADGAGGALEDFVQYAASGGDGLLNVDVDGAAGPSGWQTVVNVQGRADLDLQSLLNSGGLDIIS